MSALTAVQTKDVEIPFLKEKARWVTYDNGYTLVFVPKKGDVFNVSTWIRTGSIHENEINNGVSHFLEHLMFKGTPRFEAGVFDKRMEGMGAVINAATWKDYTFYYVTGPQGEDPESKQDNFETALDMHADMMLNASIPDEEIGPQYDPNDPNYDGEKRERSVVIEEIGMRDDQPWTKIYNKLNNMMYPEGHPYRRDVIGTREIIGNIPRDEIVSYYESWYSPENMVTVVVGDFEFEVLENSVMKSFDFSVRPEKGGEQITDWALEGAFEDRFARVDGEFQTNFFIMGYHGPDAKDLKESIALDIVSHVLGESRSSRLTQTLIEQAEQPIFNFVACGQSTIKLGNVFYVQGNFNGDNVEGCLEQVKAVVKELVEDKKVTQDEFERAKKKLKVSYAETSETSSGIADTIGESITVVGDLSLYTEYLPTLETVTLDDVHAAAKKYLADNKVFTSIMAPKS